MLQGLARSLILQIERVWRSKIPEVFFDTKLKVEVGGIFKCASFKTANLRFPTCSMYRSRAHIQCFFFKMSRKRCRHTIERNMAHGDIKYSISIYIYMIWNTLYSVFWGSTLATELSLYWTRNQLFGTSGRNRLAQALAVVAQRPDLILRLFGGETARPETCERWKAHSMNNQLFWCIDDFSLFFDAEKTSQVSLLRHQHFLHPPVHIL